MPGRSLKTRLITLAVLLLVLSTGVVVGVALEREFQGRSWIDDGGRRADRSGDRADRGRESVTRARSPGGRRTPLLVEQVGLSDSQKEEIDSIVGVYHEQMRALHEEFNDAYMSRYREILQDSREAVRGVLTEDQRVAYDSILVEYSRRRSERRPDTVSDSGGQKNEN